MIAIHNWEEKVRARICTKEQLVLQGTQDLSNSELTRKKYTIEKEAYVVSKLDLWQFETALGLYAG